MLQPQVASSQDHSRDWLPQRPGRSTGRGEKAWLLLTASPLDLSQSRFIHRRRDSDVGAKDQGGDTVCRGAGIRPGLTTTWVLKLWGVGEVATLLL